MATKSKKRRKLQALYDEIPSIKCAGKCIDECTLIPMTNVEAELIESSSSKEVFFERVVDHMIIMLPSTKRSNACPMLFGTTCSIYNDRPLICRLYGVAKGLECSKGCKPEKTLSKKESGRILDAIKKI